MLRSQNFLPSQLRAAYDIVLTSNLTNAEDLIFKLFGTSREFQNEGARTPLVNNIERSAKFRDQFDRIYSFADPTDYEYESEPSYVPDIRFTDCLYVAISNAQRHASNEYDQSVPLEGTQLPVIDEQLFLKRIDEKDEIMLSVVVREIFEPSDVYKRKSSGLFRIDGFIPTIDGDECITPQSILESFMGKYT